MNISKKEINIAILDDSNFFSTLMKRVIENATSVFKKEKGYNFRIESYIKSSDFCNDLGQPIDIAFVDYYLDQGQTGDRILLDIKQFHPFCEVIIVSRQKNIKTSVNPLFLGAFEFILKDETFLEKVGICTTEIIQKSLKS